MIVHPKKNSLSSFTFALISLQTCMNFLLLWNTNIINATDRTTYIITIVNDNQNNKVKNKEELFN